VNLEVQEGEVLAILGRNGSGKSILLQMITGNLLPQRGKIQWYKKKIPIAFLPQNPKALFMHDTVGQDIEAVSSCYATSSELQSYYIQWLQISDILSRHPHNLSGGELQRAALSLLLCTQPKLLLLDEPTKGLDPSRKQVLLSFIRSLQRKGMTVVLVTHDVEFASQVANRCALLFQREIISVQSVDLFFQDSFFYTTILRRVFRNTPLQHVTSWEEFLSLCPVNSTLS
jgi:energy-coupling factor transport system ATP-binding protein